MLCHRCTHRIITSTLNHPARALSTTTLRLRPDNPPPAAAATSTSAAQPFSTPLTPSPSKPPKLPTNVNNSTKSPPPPPPPKSSVPAGTPLNGLGYLKGSDTVLAREDDSYPAWLWHVLDPSSTSSSSKKDRGEGENEGDAFAKSKKQRKIAARAARVRDANDAKLGLARDGAVHTVRVVPLHEQSVDLPVGNGGGDGEGGDEGDGEGGRVAIEARERLRISMRDARRRKIKEQNFLRGMR